MSSAKGKGKETTDTEPTQHDDHGSSGEEEVEEVAADATTPSTSSKKKKKKRSKAAKVLNAIRGEKDAVPQQVVDVVMDKLKDDKDQAVATADEATVRKALQQMKLKELLQGKVPLGGTNKKELGEHKFWGDGPPEGDGFIEPPKAREELRQDPYPLPKDFEWASIDVGDPDQLRELYELLSNHYVEDDDASFRFQYSAQFLKWALQPPGYFKDWHVGVRVASNKRLVAFIGAIPITLRIRDNILNASEVNFLCVHKKLRSKRLAPVLIKEVTRQCNLRGVFQALYTGGIVIPTPVSTARYYHRCLNIPKLVDIRFTHVPSTMTLARMIRLHKVPERPKFLGHGLREMEEKDIPQIHSLYERYMKRFDTGLEMTEEEIKHHLLSGRGEGPSTEDSWKTPREGQVVWAYVIEDPKTNKITDFFSFFSLPSTVIDHPKHNLLRAAYLFYYATDVAFQEEGESSGRHKKRLEDILGDALIIADQTKFDVVNALTLMDNMIILRDLKFGAGDGMLNYYLFNWRTAPLSGMTEVGDSPAGRGIGVVML